jgi:hypothetical protein
MESLPFPFLADEFRIKFGQTIPCRGISISRNLPPQCFTN